MLRLAPYLIELALLVYCLIDCIQTDSVLVRNLPKTFWVFLIVFVPVVGSIAWLVAGRPERSSRGRSVPWPSTQTAGFPEYERPRPGSPDDDPQFLAGVRASDDKHEQMLREWEQQLREREARLKEEDEPS
ncbi:PLD nuclease N-terminal domain-containing protein [Cellulomonas sp. McL0617]|uniref:PLD nuclease N-terminal domain-containing protein n=1 Tax=Cellulomonas sp. McL0617 TaxID=3415675 RepID=UPI003CEA3DAA